MSALYVLCYAETNDKKDSWVLSADAVFPESIYSLGVENANVWDLWVQSVDCVSEEFILHNENSLFLSEKDQSKEKEKKVKKTIPSWATLSASQLARAQKQTPMASSPRPKMDAILTEAIKASCYFKQSTQVYPLHLSLFENSLFCPDIRNPALLLKGYSSQEAHVFLL